MQQVYEALQALYHSPDNQLKEQADSWLRQWQHSIEAWTLSDAILHDNNGSMEAKRFAASTLKLKTMKDFEDLPASTIPNLRDSLVKLMVKYFQISTIRVQIALALTYMSEFVGSSAWDDQLPLQWLATRLQQEGKEVAVNCMLDFITELPLETYERRAAVRPDRRRTFKKETKTQVQAALQILVSCLDDAHEEVQVRVVRAAGEWLYIAGSDIKLEMNNPLIQLLLNGLQSHSELFDQCVDTLCDLTRSLQDERKHHVRDEMRHLATYISQQAMTILPRFRHACDQARDSSQSGSNASTPHKQPSIQSPPQNLNVTFLDDEESIKAMARLFVEIGESLAPQIATSPDITPYSSIFEAILAVASHPLPNISFMTLYFWDLLTFHLTRRVPKDQFDVCIPKFIPYFQQYVILLGEKVIYPINYKDLTVEDYADFKHARTKVKEALQYVVTIIPINQLLDLMSQPLKDSNFQIHDWRALERVLFCARSVSKMVASPGNPTLVKLMSLLNNIPANIELLQMVCYFISGYARWLAVTMDNQQQQLSQQQIIVQQYNEMFSGLMVLLERCLSMEMVRFSAAQALFDLSCECGQRVKTNFGRLVPCFENLISTQLVYSDDRECAQIFARALSTLAMELHNTQQVMALQRLLSPIVKEIQDLNQKYLQQQQQQQQSQQQIEDFRRLAVQYDIVAAVFSQINNSQLVIVILGKIWQLIVDSFEIAGAESYVVESLSSVLKQAIKNAQLNVASLLKELSDLILVQYEKHQQGSLLYVTSQLIKVYEPDDNKDGIVGPLFTRLVGLSCNQLKTYEECVQRPDVVDDLFLLAHRGLAYAPKIVINEQILSQLVDQAIIAMLLSHREASNSVLGFMMKLARGSDTVVVMETWKAVVKKVINPRGFTIIRLLLAGCAGALPASSSAYAGDTLLEILRSWGKDMEVLKWLMDSLTPIPVESVGDNDKYMLMQLAQQLLQNDDVTKLKRAFQEALYEFCEICCRNKKSRDLALSALLPPNVKQAIGL